MQKLRARGLEIAEVRLDLARAQTPSAAAVLAEKFCEMPAVATLRAAGEGGKWRGTSRARCAILKAALPFVCAADIECAAREAKTVAAMARAAGKTVIFSRHNLSGADSPGEMRALAEKVFSGGEKNIVLKIACRIRAVSEYRAMAEFLREWRSFPIVVIGIGESEIARASRRSFPRLGSKIAFAAVAGKSAPGQLSLAETVLACRGKTKTKTQTKTKKAAR